MLLSVRGGKGLTSIITFLFHLVSCNSQSTLILQMARRKQSQKDRNLFFAILGVAMSAVADETFEDLPVRDVGLSLGGLQGW